MSADGLWFDQAADLHVWYSSARGMVVNNPVHKALVPATYMNHDEPCTSMYLKGPKIDGLPIPKGSWMYIKGPKIIRKSRDEVDQALMHHHPIILPPGTCATVFWLVFVGWFCQPRQTSQKTLDMTTSWRWKGSERMRPTHTHTHTHAHSWAYTQKQTETVYPQCWCKMFFWSWICLNLCVLFLHQWWVLFFDTFLQMGSSWTPHEDCV